MRRGFGFLGLLVTIALFVIVGSIAYNIGWSDGAAQHLPAGTAVVPPYYYGYGWHPFGFFGIFFFLLFIFGIFWLLRLAFFGRMWMRGGYKGGYGHGVPPGIEERLQDWHKRAHGEPSPTPPPPPSDQRTV